MGNLSWHAVQTPPPTFPPIDLGPASGWASALIAILALIVSLFSLVHTGRKGRLARQGQIQRDALNAWERLRRPEIVRALEELEGSARVIRKRWNEYDVDLRISDARAIRADDLSEAMGSKPHAKDSAEFIRAYTLVIDAMLFAASIVPPQKNRFDVRAWQLSSLSFYMAAETALSTLDEPRWELHKVSTAWASLQMSQASDTIVDQLLNKLNAVAPRGIRLVLPRSGLQADNG